MSKLADSANVSPSQIFREINREVVLGTSPQSRNVYHDSNSKVVTMNSNVQNEPPDKKTA
ncbi:MAG: hypothetical protein JWM92_162 [Candidatus Nomurabacteria bacterium]|nr:hypothetical protein [Candidatus Nomurabacteria bacterium]